MLQVETVVVTPFQQNCRIVFDTEGDSCAVVDPGGEAEKIVNKAKKLGKEVREIWLTHAHLDHCGGVAALKELTGAKLLGHRKGELMRSKVLEICGMYGMQPGDMQNCPEPERYIEGGEFVDFDKHRFEIYFTPGHSPDHVVFYNSEHQLLLAGDTVFDGSIGRTDLPGGDHQELLTSIRDKILTLPPETRILCGHGPDTTVEKEAKSNPFLV